MNTTASKLKESAVCHSEMYVVVTFTQVHMDLYLISEYMLNSLQLIICTGCARSGNQAKLFLTYINILITLGLSAVYEANNEPEWKDSRYWLKEYILSQTLQPEHWSNYSLHQVPVNTERYTCTAKTDFLTTITAALYLRT